ncbi:(2,3-dihydroxybenzoyl)adenylate synthase [Pseudonocardia asaccharolytica]|uniref:2,3-dihydroxybenzoate-AMP ligase n=1 Tax=Pseudonocardia asaccharolytica DSM 44247 = NBRC 16224 TaxID=1123024 RepID=A0A511CYL4_9PSEU|nr:AMP-binding protein [Pseudonocardia asaccharolytica]GEL17641.1 2,3-dihydroxybenzoate-AMP ligase [Pseudonocardia asaccharolytica DSM 44247 = NBRC 16224]
MTIEAEAPSPPFPAARAQRYVRQGVWGTRTLGDAFRAAARQHADRTALVTVEQRWTFRELDELTDGVAAGLLTVTSLRPGDRAMFQMGNVAETVLAYYGAVKAGLVPVCTLPQHGAREIGLLAEHTGARGHIVQADFRNRDLVDLAGRLSASVEVLDTLLVARGPAPDGARTLDDVIAAGAGADARRRLAEVRADPAGVVAMQLSGGTTGLPKVAPRRHQEYVYNATIWAEALGLTSGSVVLHPLPIMHNAGIAAALQPAHLAGATCVVAPSAAPGQILELIARERVTTMPVVPPAVAIRLLDDPAARSTDLSSLTRFVLGGQRPPVELLERLEAELGIPTQQMFGMAEGMFLYTPPDAPLWVRRNTVGTPIAPDDEVRVLEVGGEDEVPDGELGELACRGPYTIPGYHRAPQHNASTFTADGFYRTGDLVTRHRIDGRDWYAIDGRIKDVINRGAEKIHAEEVEELLVRHPAVHSAALVAMPDPVLGERICAYLVLKDDAAAPTVADAGAFLLEQGLAKFKLPERIEIVPEFPLTNVGKVSKKDLRADVERKIEKEGAPS